MRMKDYVASLDNGNARRIYEKMREKGYTEPQIAGVLGNLMQESTTGISPTAENKSGAFGIAQWMGSRKEKLMEMYPEGYEDLDNQIDYMLWELDNGESKAKKALIGTNNVANAAENFARKFERPHESEMHLEKRIKYGMSVLDKVKKWTEFDANMDKMQELDRQLIKISPMVADNTSINFEEEYMGGERLFPTDGSMSADMRRAKQVSAMESEQKSEISKK